MMTIWTEANFLERLKVPLKNAHEASASSCPDAEMMTAYVENSASEFVRNAVDEHLRTCADCRELAERLAGFDVASTESVTAMSAAQQAEWLNAEKRLDIEADNFVRTAEVDFKKAARVATVAKEERAAGQFPWRKTAWSVAAVAALVVAGFFLMRKDGGTVTEINSAQNVPSTAIMPPAEQSTARNPVPTTEPPIAVANASGTNTIVIPPNATSGTAAETPKIVAHAGRSTTTKRVTAKHSESAASVPADAANSATDVDTEQPSVSAANGSTSDASSTAASNAPSAEPNAGTAVVSSGLNATKGAISAAVRSHTATASRVARPASGALPAVIQLTEGTRVWIVFKTVNHTSETNFAFTGSLLEPIQGTGTTPVPKDAEIDGTGAVANGKTSLHVLEIVVGGVPYRLTGTSGAVRAAGSGSALGFNAGQVQEMWLSAPATYEKAGDTGAGGANRQP